MKTSHESVLLVFGSHLFEPKHLKGLKDSHAIFMAEDFELCTHFKYHKHKLIYFLGAMRAYAKELKEKDFQVCYQELSKENKKDSFESKLKQFLSTNKIKNLSVFEIEDKFMRSRISELCKELGVSLETRPSPLFLESSDLFKKHLESHENPFMKSFYEAQRKRLGILLTKNGKPVGGKWSYDKDNRKKLPKDFSVAPPLFPEVDKETKKVISLVDELFSDHPGSGDNFWLATTRPEAKRCLKHFIKNRLPTFGDYQDSLSDDLPFVSHSVLSPYINSGLLTPKEVVDAALSSFDKNDVPLNALEGFIRQIIGWREFVKGVYEHFSEQEEEENFWSHSQKLSSHWYKGDTGIPPLDSAINKANRYGYLHHIERLMVVGNLMLLCEVDPQEAHRWFMEMHVDSADWVMGPNVYGMSQFSDGGIFATKPYTCGSNYYLKMGRFGKGDWCDTVDGLYWGFIDKHKDFYEKNPRMGMMVKMLNKMDKKRKETILSKAKEFKKKVTESA